MSTTRDTIKSLTADHGDNAHRIPATQALQQQYEQEKKYVEQLLVQNGDLRISNTTKDGEIAQLSEKLIQLSEKLNQLMNDNQDKDKRIEQLELENQNLTNLLNAQEKVSSPQLFSMRR